MNDKQIFMSDASDVKVRKSIQDVRNGEFIALKDVPNGVTWASDDDIESLIFGSCKCNIKIEKIDCNTIRVFGSCKDLLWGNGEGTVTITLTQNGSIPSTKTHRVDGNFEFVFDISEFSTTVFFDVEADPDCALGKDANAFLGVEPNEAVCDSEERKTIWDWKEDDGVQAISFQTRYHKNFWAGYEQAHVFSYWFNGTEWINNESKLSATIDATRKSLNCIVQNNESETKTCDHCKDINASVNSLYYWHCDGDVIGTFNKELNWFGSTWNINAIQSVDFDCCE